MHQPGIHASIALPPAGTPSHALIPPSPAVHEARGHAAAGGALGASLAAHRPNAHGGALNRPGGGGKLLPTANNMGRLDARFSAGQVQLRDDLLDSLGGLSNAAINTVKVAHGSKAAAAATRSKDRADRATGGCRPGGKGGQHRLQKHPRPGPLSLPTVPVAAPPAPSRRRSGAGARPAHPHGPLQDAQPRRVLRDQRLRVHGQGGQCVPCQVGRG